MFLVVLAGGSGEARGEDARVARLKQEVREKGWLAYSARSENGTWDLFLSRPDGSDRRNVTETADFEEAAPRWAPDGTKLLYRRMAKGAVIDHDKWGFQGELILADADGKNPVALGGKGEFPWASWSPDGEQIACLTKKGIQIVDLDTKETVRSLRRKGIYQQLFWSPDGKWFCGTANHGGESWTVVAMNAETGELRALRQFQNCTPDWCPDSKHVILSSRPAGQPGRDGAGYTQLWQVDLEGKRQELLYGEDGYHIYGGALSPDGKYILFTRALMDGAGSEKGGAPICIMRTADAPSIGGESAALRTVHPETKDGPVLTLDTGWEPCWTYAEVGETE
jgi:Tol biopolymer transport system component